MTLGVADLALFAGGLLVLFLTPGPVWVALAARSMSGGFHAAWPLALGVVVGDVLWSLLAVMGMAWVVDQWGGALTVLKWIAAGVFLWMGWTILRHADKSIGANSRLTRPGKWQGFLAGLIVIIANPKAILFYMGMLPGFFDLSRLTWADIGAICGLAALVPFFGNLVLASMIDRVRSFLSSPRAVRRMNRTAGWLLIGVGLVIPLT